MADIVRSASRSPCLVVGCCVHVKWVWEQSQAHFIYTTENTSKIIFTSMNTTRAEYLKQYRLANKEKKRLYDLQYRASHKDKRRKYIEDHSEVISKWWQQYRRKHKDKINAWNSAYTKKQLATNPYFKLKHTLRRRFRKALKGNAKTASAVRDLGCSIQDFKTYIEKQFQPGMEWDNHGKWHLDHIVPLDEFDLSDRKQLLIALNYRNYQPLWAKDNLKKGTRYTLPV